MRRRQLLALLQGYRNSWAAGAVPYDNFEPGAEIGVLERLLEFVESTPDCFERSHLAGHITGSALVCDQNLSRVLLTHHRKLDKWLQLGGHSDGDPDTAAVALREAQEESGLTGLRHFKSGELGLELPEQILPFDLDIHEIPARGDVPAHLHYDVRFLVLAEQPAAPVINHESKALAWLTLEEAHRLTQEPSMLRQFAKLQALCSAPLRASKGCPCTADIPRR